MRKTALTVIILMLLAISSSAQEKPTLPDSITGTWQGNGTLHLPSAEKKAPSDIPGDNPAIKVTIQPNGTVSGTVGACTFRNCIAKKNRGRLGRMLNIKTDYIILGGYLEGYLSPSDSVLQKNFTLPFGIRDGKLTGTIMQIHKWRYPDPLVRVKLSKIPH